MRWNWSRDGSNSEETRSEVDLHSDEGHLDTVIVTSYFEVYVLD